MSVRGAVVPENVVVTVSPALSNPKSARLDDSVSTLVACRLLKESAMLETAKVSASPLTGCSILHLAIAGSLRRTTLVVPLTTSRPTTGSDDSHTYCTGSGVGVP